MMERSCFILPLGGGVEFCGGFVFLLFMGIGTKRNNRRNL